MDENGRLQGAVFAAASSGPVRRFFAGIGLLFRGLGMWFTSPKIMFLGAVPALIVGAVYTAVIITLLINIDTVIAWITPFADGWDEPWRTATHLAAGAALLGLALLIVVYTFAAITLTVGDVFYEKIWREIENRLGAAPNDPEPPFWASLRRGIGNGLRLLLNTALVGLALFVLGFIPIVGQTLVPVLGVAFGGWFLAVELTGYAFDARGLTLRDRRRMLGVRRSTTLGFGMAVYVLFLIPFAAVFVMPAAVAGATLLSRSAFEPEESDVPVDNRARSRDGGAGTP